MRRIIRTLLILTTSVLGLWSGSTAARHVDVKPDIAHHKMVEIEIPPFTVTVSTTGSTVTHAVAKLLATIPEKYATSDVFKDELSAAALQGTITALSKLGAGEVDNFSTARTIISKINEVMPNAQVQELKIKNLSAAKFQSRSIS